VVTACDTGHSVVTGTATTKTTVDSSGLPD